MSLWVLGPAVLALLFWTGLLLDRRRRWPAELFLSRAPSHSEAEVAVIVPARDEADMLPLTLPTLAEQEHERLRILVVDDRSTDGTADVARRLATETNGGERIEVVSSDPRPAGWVGKVWALESGRLSLVSGDGPPEWVLLTDSDIRHPSTSVDALLEKASKGGYDVVSVMARLHAETFWERLVIPAFVFFFHLLYPFRLVRRRSSKVMAAAGGCVLIRWSVLERSGGFASIRDAVIDDVSLARVLAGVGARVWLGFDSEIVSVRPYDGLKELWEMVARSAFVQLRLRYALVAAVVLGLFVFFVSPPFVAVWAAATFYADRTDVVALRTLACSLGALTIQARLLGPFVGHHRLPGVYALTLPLSSILYAGMTVSSAWRHLRGRGVRWKGRSYRE